MMAKCLVLVAMLACASSAWAGDSLEALAWLEGHWEAEAFGGTIEEIWLPAAGNAMHGVFRLTVEGQMEFSEFLQVTAEDGRLVMRFEHFNPDYSTWEGDGPPMELTATELTEDRVVFEAANEASPGRIVYHQVAEELRVTVTGLDGVLRFQRSDPRP